LKRTLSISSLILGVLAATGLPAQTLSVDKTSMTFSAQSGGAKVSQTLNISSLGGSVAFFATSNTTNPNWLTVNPQTGNTPSAVTVTADPTGLNPGIYGASLSIFVGATVAVTVPVSFSVSSIGASPQSLQFTTVFGSTPLSQTIALSGTFSFTAVANSTPGWLIVGPTTGNSPATLNVGLNSAVMATLIAGTYNGSIVITPAGSPSLTVLVTLIVTPTPPVTVSPASLNLGFQVGGANNAAASQTLTVATTAGQTLAFTVSSSVDANPSGKNWITTSASVAGATGSVQVGYDSTVALPPGTYAGNVQVSAPGFTPATTNISVKLLVSPFPLLIVPAAPLNFTFELSGVVPPSQSVTATATTGTIPFTVGVASATNGGNWIVVTPPAAGFSSGTPFSVAVNPVGLVTGNYTGTITVTPGAGTGSVPQQIPVNLTVANDALIVANGCEAASAACSLSFAYQIGQAAPSTQNINVNTSTGAPLNYTATAATTSCGSWLGLTGSTGLTNGVVTVSVLNPTSLGAGPCSGTISIAATNAATGVAAPNSPLTIPVNLLVSSTPLLLVSPASLTFTVPVNGQSSQAVSLTSTSTANPLNYTLALTPITGANWISVNQFSGTTPNSLQITATPGALLSPGTYTGTVTVTATGLGGAAVANSPVTIPLTLQVTAGTLSVSPATLSFSQLAGAPASAPQAVQVSSNGLPLTYNAVASTNGSLNWLSVSPSNGTTGGSFSVTADGSKLTAGTYPGVITVTGVGPNGSPVAGNPATVQVTLVVTAGTVSAAPASLTFTQAAGGPAPAAQTVTVSGTPGPINFTVAAGGGTWLTAIPASGTTPGTIQVSASAGTLAVGQYTGTVTITAPSATGSPISIPVTLNVVAGQVITATPATLAFTSVIGAAVPVTQQVQAATTGSSIPLSVTASTKDGANWLTVTPATAATPATLTVSVNPQTLAAGTYTGTVTINSPNASTPATVPVTLTVLAVPNPVINAIANAASFANGPVAPGENIVIFGAGIGPATLVGLHVTNGVVDSLVGNTRVLFDGVAAPVIYASAGQTSVMVPYGVAGRTSTNVQVEFLGVQSAPIAFNLVQTTPGIYTLNQAGTGPGATLNQDGSVNGSGKPAAKGSVVAVYMTGEGLTTPGGADGTVIPLDGSGLKKPNLLVTATIGGVATTVTYAGSAPGIVSGVMQVNLQIPAGAASGTDPLIITVGTTPCQTGVTIAVQ
jgi:uncharacterized protein (TIGR03437 family)